MTAAEDAPTDPQSVAAVFEEYSTQPLLRCEPEPPDVAMDIIHGEPRKRHAGELQ